MTELPVDLTEDQALDLFHQLKTRFGWAGVVWIRGDVEAAWEADIRTVHDDECTDPECDWKPPTMPDTVWARIQDTWEWSRGLGESDDHDWDLIAQAVTEAITEADYEEALRHG